LTHCNVVVGCALSLNDAPSGRAFCFDSFGPMTGWLDATKGWARRIKRDVVALWIAARDPRTPMMAKIAAGAVAAYALSPIDLIPDFVLRPCGG